MEGKGEATKNLLPLAVKAATNDDNGDCASFSLPPCPGRRKSGCPGSRALPPSCPRPLQLGRGGPRERRCFSGSNFWPGGRGRGV